MATIRTDFFTSYADLEKVILNNIGKLHSSGVVTSTPTSIRLMAQDCFNMAVVHANGIQEARNLSNKIAAYTLTVLYDWDLDLITDLNLQYILDLQSIHLYNNSTSAYSILKYKTPSSFIAQCLPNIMVSSGVPKLYTLIEGRYLWLYPRPDLLYTLNIRYKVLPAKIINYTGNSPFENEYDYILTSLATAFFWLNIEEIELGNIWLQIANSLLTKKAVSMSLPVPMDPSSSATEALRSKPYTDPMVD
jgi:hypothetical protein